MCLNLLNYTTCAIFYGVEPGYPNLTMPSLKSICVISCYTGLNKMSCDHCGKIFPKRKGKGLKKTAFTSKIKNSDVTPVKILETNFSISISPSKASSLELCWDCCATLKRVHDLQLSKHEFINSGISSVYLKRKMTCPTSPKSPKKRRIVSTPVKVKKSYPSNRSSKVNNGKFS